MWCSPTGATRSCRGNLLRLAPSPDPPRRNCSISRGLARGGQPHGATRPVKQRLTHLAFQPLNLGADRRLRDADALGGAGEVGLLGDGDEVFELPEFHSR